MKTLKQILGESDYTDPKSPGDKAFVDKHVVARTDYPHKPKGGSNDEVFKGAKQKKHKHLADPEEGQDEEMYERTLTKSEARKKETMVKGMKKHTSDFVKRYGDDAESVMHAVATKQAKEEIDIVETMQRVLETEQDHPFTFNNGDVLDIDHETAKQLMDVYEELTDENREQFVSSLERNQNHFKKLLDFSATVGV